MPSRSRPSPYTADDRLFATLDPATRRVQLPSGRACRLTDTVGFLQRLPTKLVASFRATLEEVADACLLLHVVDSSSSLGGQPDAGSEGHCGRARCRDTPPSLIYNKQDLCEDEEVVFELDNLPKSMWTRRYLLLLLPVAASISCWRPSTRR